MERSRDLLENHPSLKTAITKRFQLYINVSFIASQKETEEAHKIGQEPLKT